MKKALALLLALALTLALAACGNGNANSSSSAAADVKGEGVATHEEYLAAELDSQLTIETYVQATQSWWDGKITVYSQDKDGAYFLYDMACSEEDAKKLLPGQKIKVTGYKAEWNGQVEIMDGTFEFEDGSYIAPATDISGQLGDVAALEKLQNFVIAAKDLTVEAADDSGAAFLYNWDGSGSDGDDLYFKAGNDSGAITFVVRRYLTAPGSEVYEAVKNLKVGDKIDLEGFLYWYEGPQPHISSITVK